MVRSWYDVVANVFARVWAFGGLAMRFACPVECRRGVGTHRNIGRVRNAKVQNAAPALLQTACMSSASSPHLRKAGHV